MKSKGAILLRFLLGLFCSLLAVSCASELSRQPQPVSPATECSPHVNYAFSFGSSGQLPGQFRSPSSVAVDSFGNVLIADTGNSRIQKFDSSGRFLMEFGGLGSDRGGLDRPTDAVENALSIYVVDSMNERVVEYDWEGRFLAVCFSGNRFLDSRRSFGPRKIEFSQSGYVFLTDVEADAVIVFSTFWEPISEIGGFGTGEGRFSNPAGLASGPGEEVFVCDSGNRRLQKLDSLGNLAGVLDVCSERSACEPVDIDVGSDGSLYVVDEAGGRVLVFGADGVLGCEIPGTQDPSFISPCAVAVSSRGFLYVVDGGADVVHVFELHGAVPKPDAR